MWLFPNSANSLFVQKIVINSTVRNNCSFFSIVKKFLMNIISLFKFSRGFFDVMWIVNVIWVVFKKVGVKSS